MGFKQFHFVGNYFNDAVISSHLWDTASVIVSMFFILIVILIVLQQNS